MYRAYLDAVPHRDGVSHVPGWILLPSDKYTLPDLHSLSNLDLIPLPQLPDHHPDAFSHAFQHSDTNQHANTNNHSQPHCHVLRYVHRGNIHAQSHLYSPQDIHAYRYLHSLRTPTNVYAPANLHTQSHVYAEPDFHTHRMQRNAVQPYHFANSFTVAVGYSYRNFEREPDPQPDTNPLAVLHNISNGWTTPVC